MLFTFITLIFYKNRAKIANKYELTPLLQSFFTNFATKTHI